MISSGPNLLLRKRRVFLGRDPDAALWAAAVVANGGSVSAARLAIVNTFVTAQIASGAWFLGDDFWPLWGEDADTLGPQSSTSLKQRRLITWANTPTGTIDRGVAFNGTTQYGDTGFIAALHAQSMHPASARLAVYERTNVSANTYAVGAQSGGPTSRLSIRPRSASSVFGEAISNSATHTLGVANSQGYTAISQSGGVAAGCLAYKNGGVLTRAADPTAFDTARPNVSLFIGARNNVGSAAGFRAASIGFVAVGAALSAAQELAEYNAVQAWATSIGANV